ncbi:hypothetical protein ABE438_14580 [Bosea sp. TWI1241]|uniref:hypothetical protein n=1 Tax=Bosea sp. TWI1241 TaxID=3148904 RepID=UPI00320A1350
MSRQVSFKGNTLILNDEAPALKVGDRVSFVVIDWMEGEHPLTGEVVSIGNPPDIARVRIGASLTRDIVFEVPAAALTVLAPVVPLGGRAR